MIKANLSNLILAFFSWVIIASVIIIYSSTSSIDTIYYVAKDGNDSNPGTEALPWLTITKAANTLNAGDTVYVRAGTYHEQVTINNSGSPGKYITFAAYPGDKAIIKGTGLLPVIAPDIQGEKYGLIHMTSNSYIIIDGFHFQDAPQRGIQTESGNNIIIRNNVFKTNVESETIKTGWRANSNIIIENNIIDRTSANGYWGEVISVSRGNNIIVRNNHVIGNAYGGEGINIKDGSSNVKVYNNIVENTQATGIYIDTFQDYQYNIEVYNNIVRNIKANGITTGSERGGLLENVRFYNNIIYNIKAYGMALTSYSESSSYIPKYKDIFFINNVVYNASGSIYLGTERDGMIAKNIVVRNNIASNGVNFQIVQTRPNGGSVSTVIDHNLIDGHRGYSGETRGTDYVEANPQFVNPDNGDFRLQSTSPAVDAGSSVNAPSIDFDGNSRPKGKGHDIGAFELI